MKTVSIIIVNYNLAESIENLLFSVYRFFKGIDFEIIVVDNNSPEKIIKKLPAKFPEIRFLSLPSNYGFGYANNRGAEIAKGKYYLFLNPDTYITQNILVPMIEFFDNNPDCAVIGPKLKYENGTTQESAMKFPNVKQELLNMFGFAGKGILLLKKIRHYFLNEAFYSTDFVFGSCMMIRANVFKIVNGFDEDYFLFTEEADLCLRIKLLKFKVVYLRNIDIIHSSGKITNKISTERIRWTHESKLIFWKKHYSKSKVLLLRLIIIISLKIRLMLVSYLKKNKSVEEHRKVYKYLVSYFKIGVPKKNIITS